VVRSTLTDTGFSRIDAYFFEDRNEIGRERRAQHHRLARGRMLNRQRLGMQTDARDNFTEGCMLLQAPIQGSPASGCPNAEAWMRI